MKLKTATLGLALALATLYASGERHADDLRPAPLAGWHRVIEAEAMQLTGDWSVARGSEGYTPGAPNIWSGNRLRGGPTEAPASATSEIEIPSDGRYAFWIRYESPYGFDVHFNLSVTQNGTTCYDERFGDRADAKNFAGVWRVQGPWSYHNTDFVYQRGEAGLKAGPATIKLSKSSGGKYMAARIVDLIFITADLELEPGREMRAWREWGHVKDTMPGIMPHCNRPFYFRLQRDGAAEPGRVVITYRQGSGYRGPRRALAFNTNREFTERYEYGHKKLEQHASRKRYQFPEDETLPAGFDSGWIRYDLNTFGTASIATFSEKGNATLSIARTAAGSDAAEFKLTPNNDLNIWVATGNDLLEADIFDGRTAATLEDLALGMAERLARYQPPGKRPAIFHQLVSPSEALGKGRWPLFEAAGGNGIYFRVPPDAYLPENATKLGVNRQMAFRTLQNMVLRFQNYEGDYDYLRNRMQMTYDELKEQGLGDLPQTSKMIEESGPPPLAKMRGSAILSEKFRNYLKECQLKPVNLLDRATLASAMAAGKVNDADLWPLVVLPDGTPGDAAENPVLFYHAKEFGNLLFADNCAEAVKLLEEIFPAGSYANSGAIYPQDGHGMRRNWYDEFTLFRRRGMTSFGSEISWGLNGMPHYAALQTQSYEGTMGRGVAKYHAATLGPTHLLACRRYGYPAEFIEIATYALASHGYNTIHNFINDEFTGLEHYKAIKRAGYAIGAVEERLVGATFVPGRVALGWSETTSIWDQAEPPGRQFREPANVTYALERQYLYLLLRHLQLSVDLVSEADVAEGRLKDYDLYFAVGDHITQAAANALRQWVEAGGVLIATAGGGLWDEYNRPLETLKEVYGIRGARQHAAEQGTEYIPGATYEVDVNDNRLDKVMQAPRAKLELLHALPLDTVSYREWQIPVLAYKQGLTPEGGQASANFASGGAAIVSRSYGQGQALIMGFLPGIAYHYQAYPLRPFGRGGEDLSTWLYPEYKPLLREALTAIIKQVWPAMGAPVTASNPYVEANLMRDAKGDYSIAVVNYSGAPLDELELHVRKADVAAATTATARFSQVSVVDGDTTLVVKLPLKRFEFVTLGR